MTSKPTLKIYHQRNIRVDENCQEIAVCCIHWERKVELKVMLLHTGPKLTAYMWTMTVSARWKSNSIQVKKIYYSSLFLFIPLYHLIDLLFIIVWLETTV